MKGGGKTKFFMESFRKRNRYSVFYNPLVYNISEQSLHKKFSKYLLGEAIFNCYTRVFPKVSGLATWS
jgi:hypothetical protein